MAAIPRVVVFKISESVVFGFIEFSFNYKIMREAYSVPAVALEFAGAVIVFRVVICGRGGSPAFTNGFCAGIDRSLYSRTLSDYVSAIDRKSVV